MNYDITFCTNTRCPSRKSCGRDTNRLADYQWPVSMACFKPDKYGYCEHHIKTTKEKSNENPR